MADNRKYAGLWPRFLALFIDFLLFCALFFPATRLVKGVWLMQAADHRWHQGLFITDPLCVGFLIVMFGYFVFLEGLAGATFGKYVLGLRVETSAGEKPGIRGGFIRNILRIIDGLPALNILGVILIVMTKENTRFGDLAAGTRVVCVKQSHYDEN